MAELTAEDVDRRLDELSENADRWLCKVLHGGVMTSLRESLHDLHRRGIPYPYLYPTPDGGINAEWGAASMEMSLPVGNAVFETEYGKNGACDVELRLRLFTESGRESLARLWHHIAETSQ